jgi:hypothetical protein
MEIGAWLWVGIGEWVFEREWMEGICAGEGRHRVDWPWRQQRRRGRGKWTRLASVPHHPADRAAEGKGRKALTEEVISSSGPKAHWRTSFPSFCWAFILVGRGQCPLITPGGGNGLRGMEWTMNANAREWRLLPMLALGLSLGD